MKRILTVLLMLSMILLMAAGCAGKPQEESASLGEYVEKEDMPQQNNGGSTGTGAENNDQETPDTGKENPNTGKENNDKNTADTGKEDTNTGKEEPNTGKEETNTGKEDPDTGKEDTDTGDPPGEDPDTPVSNLPIDYSGYIKVATYNVCRLDDGKSLQAVVDVLKEIDADIVGLQEIDVNNTRSAPVHGTNYNQVQILAYQLGYDYWYYAPSIEPWNGGSYGHGILSRYPIKKSENVNYDIVPSNDHNRNFSRHVLDVNGKELVFYNTHLTAYGTNADRGAELKQALGRMYQDQYAVLTGDLNFTPDAMVPYVNTDKVTVLNGGDDLFEGIPSFPQGENSRSAIDNIIVTDTMNYYWDADAEAGVIVHQADCSDHNAVYSYIQFK